MNVSGVARDHDAAGGRAAIRGLDLLHFKGDNLVQKLTYAKTKVPLFQS